MTTRPLCPEWGNVFDEKKIKGKFLNAFSYFLPKSLFIYTLKIIYLANTTLNLFFNKINIINQWNQIVKKMRKVDELV